MKSWGASKELLESKECKSSGKKKKNQTTKQQTTVHFPFIFFLNSFPQ